MKNSGLFIFYPMTKYLLFILLFPILVFSQNINPKKEKIFQDIVTSLQTPNEVTNLNLRANNLFEVPIEIQKLKNLKHLNLMKNNIEFWSETNTNFQKLEVLLFNENELKQIPNSIDLCQNLLKISKKSTKYPSLNITS